MPMTPERDDMLMMARGGVADVAKVVDFGLVKRFRVDSTDQTMAVTVQTALVGTPYYLAPEAIRGEVDARSDLYTLGAVAYLLLTATPVFRGPSIVEVCAHHLHRPPEPPSSRLGRAIAPEVERLVKRCLAKAPADRPASARALGAELAAARFVGSWSAEDAERWWATYRERGSPRPEAVATAATRA
jgi:serine/threonine-protein kinase